jgi:hypothetical protein
MITQAPDSQPLAYRPQHRHGILGGRRPAIGRNPDASVRSAASRSSSRLAEGSRPRDRRRPARIFIQPKSVGILAVASGAAKPYNSPPRRRAVPGQPFW